MKSPKQLISSAKVQLSEDWKELKKIVHNNDVEDKEKPHRLNRFLSNNIVMAATLTIIDILLLICFNYVSNVIGKVPQMRQGTESISSYLGIENIVVPFSLIFNYSAWRFVYFVFLILITILDVVFCYEIKTSLSEKSINKNQKGKERWATLEEIQQQYKEIDELETEYDGMPGFLISRYGNKFYIDTNNTNNLIIGITRSGKDEMYVFPSIDIYSRAKIKPSMIIADVKAESYKSSQKKHVLQKRGYDVYFMNLQFPEESMGYNPLELVIQAWEDENYTFAEDLTQTFVWQIFDPESATGNEKYFCETGANLTAGLILAHVEDCLRMDKEINEKRWKAYEKKTAEFKKLDDEEKECVRKQHAEYIKDELLDPDVRWYPDDIPFEKTHEYRDMINMYSIINTYFELASQKLFNKQGVPTGQTMLDLYFINRPSGNRAKMKYMSTAVAGSKTKANVYSTMNTKLTIYTMETVAKMTAESSLNISDIGFGDKPIAVFLGIPDADQSKHQIAATFIRQVYTMLAMQCWDGGKCKRPVKFILNEFGNLPKIEGMKSIITVCAGRNITFDLYVQDYAQIDSIYNQDAKTIRSNCGNKIYIRSDDEDTRKSFAEMVGNKTEINSQRNGTKLGLRKTFMETPEEKPLIRPTELTELLEGETIVARTMKVKDNDGNDVKMYPIFNSKESDRRLKFRWRYLSEYFPDAEKISLSEVNEESRKHIKLKNRVWDYNQSFKFIEKDIAMSTRPLRIKDLEEREVIKLTEALKKVMDQETLDRFTDIEEISLAEAYNIIDCENDAEKINTYQRKSIISLLNHYLEREELKKNA